MNITHEQHLRVMDLLAQARVHGLRLEAIHHELQATLGDDEGVTTSVAVYETRQESAHLFLYEALEIGIELPTQPPDSHA